MVIASRDLGPAATADLQALGHTLEQRSGRPNVEIDPRAIVRVVEPAMSGERAAIAAGVGVLLRERVG